LARFVSWANPGTRDRNLTGSALGRGVEGSAARLQLRGADGRPREVTLLRSKVHLQPAYEHRSGEAVRLLPGNLGYVDLDRLNVSDVDAMFEQLKDTIAIVFDMRGYPNGTAWAIAPRLNVKGAKDGPIFEPPQLFGGVTWEEPGRGQWVQPLPPGEGKPIYRGRVVMLIDARTQSQAEHTGLFFEAACDVIYVGSPSAGSNGDVTRLVLPGGLDVSFSGQGVRHPDGRPLQRVGLTPHIAVAPTVAGLRAGRDEVLQRAIEFIQTGHERE
jgi:C-terminal processing protease CtpA/Prc